MTVFKSSFSPYNPSVKGNLGYPRSVSHPNQLVQFDSHIMTTVKRTLREQMRLWELWQTLGSKFNLDSQGWFCSSSSLYTSVRWAPQNTAIWSTYELAPEAPFWPIKVAVHQLWLAWIYLVALLLDKKKNQIFPGRCRNIHQKREVQGWGKQLL